MEVDRRLLKKTFKNKCLLALDKFFMSLYPLRLNHWIFDSLDRETEEVSKNIMKRGDKHDGKR